MSAELLGNANAPTRPVASATVGNASGIFACGTIAPRASVICSEGVGSVALTPSGVSPGPTARTSSNVFILVASGSTVKPNVSTGCPH